MNAENVLAGFEDDEDAFRVFGSLYTSAGFSDVCETLASSSFLPPHALIMLQTARKRKIGPIIRQMIIERSPAAKDASLLILASNQTYIRYQILFRPILWRKPQASQTSLTLKAIAAQKSVKKM